MDSIAAAIAKAGPEALPELADFLRPFASLLRYRQSRESLERYVTGLLTDLSPKNCDTIAAAVAGTSTERLQHLLTDALLIPSENWLFCSLCGGGYAVTIAHIRWLEVSFFVSSFDRCRHGRDRYQPCRQRRHCRSSFAV